MMYKAAKMSFTCLSLAKILCVLVKFIDDSLMSVVSDMPFIRIGLHSFSGLSPAMNKLSRGLKSSIFRGRLRRSGFPPSVRL